MTTNNYSKTMFKVNLTTYHNEVSNGTTLDNGIEVDLTGETVVIAVTVGMIGVVLLATLYGAYRVFKHKRQMTVTVTSPVVPVPNYFTHPKEPILFQNEMFNLPSNQEPTVYWSRPLQPVATDKDIYSCIISNI